MPDLIPTDPPALVLAVRALEETDYALPATWNEINQVLLDNDAALKAQLDANVLEPGAATDVIIGSRTVNDALTPSTDTNTLTTLLGNLANRIRVATGGANWRETPATTLAAASAHISDTAPHQATAAATAGRLVLRDAAGRAKVAAPLASDDIARKAEVDATSASLATHIANTQPHVPAGTYVARTPRSDQRVAYADLVDAPSTFDPVAHDHDDRYYTETELGASGASAVSVHADRVNAGILATARIPSLDAGKVTTGIFATARIPSLDASKVTTGAFDAARIPSLDASKVTTGVFGTARIPDLDASKITSGTLDANRIPNLSAAKITSGTLPATRGGTGWTSFPGSNYFLVSGSTTTLNLMTGASVRSIIGAADVSNVVTLTTTQNNISGQKTFTGAAIFTGTLRVPVIS